MKIVVVGGGCSGVCFAINAKNDNNEVIILERGDKILKKLLMTGNGRCNYYNEDQDISHYHSNGSNVDAFINNDNLELVLDFFDSMGIVPKIKNGYYYPFSNQASTIRDAFITSLLNLGVTVKCNYLVNSVKKDNGKFIINGDIVCDKLVIATGSFAYPKTGSDGMGYDFLKDFGHNIIPVLPSLVQLISNNKFCSELDGVRSDAILSLYEDGNLIRVEAGEVQLTDYGISGICTFNLSYYVSRGLVENKREVIGINFVPFIDGDIKEYFVNYSRKVGRITIYELLSRLINKKICSVILKKSCIERDTYFEDLDEEELKLLFNNLTNFEYVITGTKGFLNSQVCSGGIDICEINPKNFESLIVNDLYILGELVDICGDCGGYNLTLCWISGILAGRYIGGLND